MPKKSAGPQPSLDVPVYKDVFDFTTYVAARDSSTVGGKNAETITGLLGPKPGKTENAIRSYSDNVYPKAGGVFRSLICSSFQGRHYSISLRRLRQEALPVRKEISYNNASNNLCLSQHEHVSNYSAVEKTANGKTSKKESPSQVGKKPEDTKPPEDQGPSKKELFELSEYVDLLFEEIFRPDKKVKKPTISEQILQPVRKGIEEATQSETNFKPGRQIEEPTGLVIIAGATSSQKSRIVRGVIHSYLTELIKNRSSDGTKPCEPRRPHLITFEDPIEALYYDTPRMSLEFGLDYTPRQKGIDVANLDEFLRDCLRQTPSVVYIGETRDLRDWRKLADFAGTGHLVFTTCHAGSLTEVIGTLCKAVNADTAAKRGSLAARLAAVIHLRRATLEFPDTERPTKETRLPALLRKTATGINALTGDGLAALLPHSYSAGNQEVNRYCYGRSFFADQLLGNATEKLAAAYEDSQLTYSEKLRELQQYSEKLRKLAVQFDLEGL